MLSPKLIRHARIEARRLSKLFCQTLAKLKYHNFYAPSLNQKCLLVFNPSLFLYNFFYTILQNLLFSVNSSIIWQFSRTIDVISWSIAKFF